ncbi:hypothetical protein Droror1_Dr00022495 [Drosera rotundifolia]
MKSKEIMNYFLKPFMFNSNHKDGSKEDDIEKLAAQEQKHFSYESLSKATDKFNPDRKLGEGGFGPVYKLISGRRNSSFLPIADDAENLLDWAYKSYKKEKSLEIVDPTLAVREEADQVSMCIYIGLLCVQSDPRLRPDMRRVVVLLSKRSCPQEEPTRPGMPGTRYRRSRHGSTSSSNAGTSGGASFSSTSTSTTNPPAPTLITSTPGTSMSDYQKSGPSRTRSVDPYGKRPIEHGLSG